MRLALLLFFNCCVNISYAQDSAKAWRHAITWKPLGLINPVLSNFTAGLLLKPSKNILLEFQGGYIYRYKLLDYQIDEKVSLNGFKTNLEFKYIFSQYFYAGAQVFYLRYKKENNEYYDRMARTYQELITIEKQVNTFVTHIKSGFIFPIVEDNILIDIYAGFGMRYKMVDIVNSIPEDASVSERRGVDFSTDQIGNQYYPSVTAGFSLGYIIK
jgi:hypothetical protein